jgi:hypothetical protein
VNRSTHGHHESVLPEAQLTILHGALRLGPITAS